MNAWAAYTTGARAVGGGASTLEGLARAAWGFCSGLWSGGWNCRRSAHCHRCHSASPDEPLACAQPWTAARDVDFLLARV